VQYPDVQAELNQNQASYKSRVTHMSNRPINVTEPALPPLESLLPYLEKIWQSKMLTNNGELVQQFEKRVSNRVDVSNFLAVSNGTMALQLAIKALGLSGKEIITTPFTWIATVSSILWEQCIPVFADIDPATLNIDPKKIVEKVSDKTGAILPVHIFGNPCNVNEIDAISLKYSIPVIYDGAHAFGTKVEGKSVFDFGDISTVSFHATKLINTAEGGGCFSKDARVHQQLQRMRYFGHDTHRNIVSEGTNAKLSELHAALGLASLEILPDVLNERRSSYDYYLERLSGNQTLSFQKVSEGCNRSYFPVIFQSERDALSVIDNLSQKSITVRRYFYPTVNSYSNILTHSAMPLAEDISSRIICLPLYSSMPIDAVDIVCDTILEALK
jgi:dTDP-4-amino-4,6-dideoxygalactose transaminase